MATRKARHIELTIKAESGTNSYLPRWGIREGIRELIQNAKDAETEFNAPMAIEWYKGTTGREVLRVTNEGCNLPREALLFGHTTKYGREDLIGRYGEGFKLFLLVLVREGLKVKVFTGNDEDRTGEIWIPEIKRSETFNAEVLSINIKDAEYRKRVRVEVEGISKYDWERFKKDYLFLSGTDKGKFIQTSYGELLLDQAFKGRVYVKGIFVEQRDTNYGYNFSQAELDRDRKMVDWWSWEDNKAKIMDEAVRTKKFTVKELLNLMEADSADIRGGLFTSRVSEETLSLLHQEFINKHGENAVPLAHASQAIELEHLSSNKGVVVPDTLYKTLEKKFGPFEAYKKKLANEVAATYAFHELESSERDNLLWSLVTINDALAKLNLEKIALGAITVCDFRDNKLLGQYDSSTGTIKLGKRSLVDRLETLLILVHEVSHRFGSDAEKSHSDYIQRIWMHIVGNLAGIAKVVSHI